MKIKRNPYQHLLFTSYILLLFFLFSCNNSASTSDIDSEIYEKINHSVEYINPDEALGDKNFKTCGSYIFNYYNPQKASYSKGKNNLRRFILSNYVNENYSDSGYLNILFVINCKGEAGRYKVYENNLDLEPQKFNSELKTQLINLTMKLKKWNPNFIQGEYVDSSMYISYRIENGKITEILP